MLTGEYTGTDNLAMMAEAVNYNTFLLELVLNNAIAADRIVDFGAGLGTVAAFLTENGLNVHCVEPDHKHAAIIAELGLTVSPDMDALTEASVDFLYSLNVLEHIHDDTATLTSMATKLKTGGRVLIYVPAFQILFSSMDRKVGHYRRYRSAEFCRKLGAAGLRVVTARYVDCLGFFASLLFKGIGNDSGDLDSVALRVFDRYVFPLSRILDHVFGRFFGKNLLVIAVKDERTQDRCHQ